jgi:hypothetical protein
LKARTIYQTGLVSQVLAELQQLSSIIIDPLLQALTPQPKPPPSSGRIPWDCFPISIYHLRALMPAHFPSSTPNEMPESPKWPTRP